MPIGYNFCTEKISYVYVGMNPQIPPMRASLNGEILSYVLCMLSIELGKSSPLAEETVEFLQRDALCAVLLS